MSESGKKSSSEKTTLDKTPSSQAKCPDIPEPPKMSRNNFHSQLSSFIENLKKFLKTDLKKPAITSELSNVISNVEKVIKDSCALVVKKVTDFAENDLQKFRTMSKEETEKTRKILLQYAATMQKISEEKLNHIMEVKERLRMRILKREELHSVAKFCDAKMTEVKKLTEELYKSLSKGEAALFVKDLQKIVETQSNAVKYSLNSFLAAAKENIPKLQVSLKSVSAKSVLSKLPKIPDNYKLPTSFSKEKQQTTEAVKKSMVSLKNKLQINIEKFINSDRIYARTNVAKATYTSIILFYLYKKFNRAEVVETQKCIFYLSPLNFICVLDN